MALAALVGTQLGQTLLVGKRNALVLATGLGSTAALVAVIQTPGLSQFFGCTPLGPFAWGIVTGCSAGTTLLAAVAGPLFHHQRPPGAAMTDTTATSGPGSALPAATATPGPDAPAPQAAPSGQHDLLTDAATAVALPFTLTRSLVPDSAVPVALGAGALALVGALDWPAAAAVALGYLALRGWRRSTPGPA